MHLIACDVEESAFVWNAFAVFKISGPVFWPYFAGITLLAIGLPIILKNELSQEHGVDKILPFGRLFFVVPIAAFAAQHFTSAKFIAPIVPSWIPGHVF